MPRIPKLQIKEHKHKAFIMCTMSVILINFLGIIKKLVNNKSKILGK